MKNREIELSDSELTAWCHLAPFGEYPGERDGERVKQVCDRDAFDAVCSAFAPEVLVDFEHFSENSDDTTAAAWVQDLAIRDDGLWGLCRFTDVGAEAVRGRRLRFLSPVWPLDADGRPAALKSVALTNTPNFTLRPVLNKAAPGGENQTKQKGPNMKELAALYGLPETATEAEILAAAKAAKEKADALETRLAELEKAALNTEAEQAAEENAAKIEDKEKFKELYVANKDFALRMLEAVKAPPAQPVLNKSDARKPRDVFGPAVQNKLAQYREMPAGKEKDAYLQAHAAELLRLERAEAKG